MSKEQELLEKVKIIHGDQLKYTIGRTNELILAIDEVIAKHWDDWVAISRRDTDTPLNLTLHFVTAFMSVAISDIVDRNTMNKDAFMKMCETMYTLVKEEKDKQKTLN